MTRRTAGHNRRDLERDPEVTARREFLATIRRTAVTAPAVALLLSASAKPASAQDWYSWSTWWK